MGVTLWIDTSAETTVDLGGTLACYKSFADMARVAGDEWEKTYEALAGVLSQCEDQSDADPEWLADMRDQAGAFLARYRDGLDDAAVEILRTLADG
jgi:hypothetical protein